MAPRKGKTVKAAPKVTATEETTPTVEPVAAPPTRALVDVLDWQVSDLLDHVGIDREKMIKELEAWKARHPNEAPLAQQVQNLITQYLGAAELQRAANAIGIGLTQLVFEGKGPVQHSGAELV